MSLRKSIGAAALCAAALYSTSAASAVIGTLVYDDPTGTAFTTDSIDVWVTLTLDPSSDSLTFDRTDPFPSGIDPADIPTEAWDWNTSSYVPFETYDFIGPTTIRYCDDTFTVGCRNPGSQYTYTTGSDWPNFSGTINPGESVSFKLFELDPVGGSAAPGTYQLFTAGIGLSVYGEDPDGNQIDADIYQFFTDCPDTNCVFTREVSAVPIPAAAWLFGSALFGLAGIARRRARQ